MEESHTKKYYATYKEYWQGLNWGARAHLMSSVNDRWASEEFIFARTEWLQEHPLEKLPPNVQKEVNRIRSDVAGKDLYYRRRVEDEVHQFLVRCNEERFLAWLNAPKEQEMEKWDLKESLNPPPSPNKKNVKRNFYSYDR